MSEEKLLTEREAKVHALEMAVRELSGNGGPGAASRQLNLPNHYLSTEHSAISRSNVSMVMNAFHGVVVGLLLDMKALMKEKDGSGEEANSGEGKVDSRNVRTGA